LDELGGVPCGKIKKEEVKRTVQLSIFRGSVKRDEKGQPVKEDTKCELGRGEPRKAESTQGGEEV